MTSRIFFLWIAYALLMGFALGGSFVSSYLTPPAIEQSCGESQTGFQCQSPEENRRAAEDALSYYTKWLMVFTAVLAAATLAMGIATTGLYSSGQDQIRLARDEFLSSHRPQLRLKHIWLATQDGQRFFGNLQAGMPITVRLDIVNIGNTEAFVRLINYVTIFLEAGEPLPQRPPYNEPNVTQFVLGDLPLGSGITVTPSVSDGRILNSNEIGLLRVEHKRLYFVGTIEYWWGADRRNLRQTAFCRYIHVTPPKMLGGQSVIRFQKHSDPDYEFQD